MGFLKDFISITLILLASMCIFSVATSTKTSGVCLDVGPKNFLIILILISLVIAIELSLIKVIFSFFVKSKIIISKSYLLLYAPVFLVLMFGVIPQEISNKIPLPLMLVVIGVSYLILLMVYFYILRSKNKV